MKIKGGKLLSLVLVLLMITIISSPKSVFAEDQNQLTLYPDPPAGTASYSAFTAQVRNPGGSYSNLFPYLSRMFNGDSGDPGKSDVPTGFVMFDSAGTVEMKITYNGGPLTSAKVWPQAYGITPTIDGQEITFSLTGAKNIVLEVNGNIYNALHIFANPMDTNAPSPTDPNVMYFGPGLHQYGNDSRITRLNNIPAHQNSNYMTTEDVIDVPSGKTVYIAGGAVVKAQIRTNPYLNETGWDTRPMKENITIRGRGILDLSQWCGNFTDAARATQPEMPGIVAFRANNVTIEGVVVVNPERQSVNVIGSSNVTIDNIKGFTSMHEGDGIVLVMDNSHVTVKNSFVRTSDDALVTGANSHDILWENNVIASMRVHSFMVNAGNLTNYVAKNNYVINSNAYPGIRGVIGIYAGSALVQNVTFENIEIERTRYGSMLEIYPYSIWNHVTGSLSNIVFKNVNYASNPYDFGSQIGGISETEYVDGVHFDNVKVDGKLVTDSKSGNLSIGSYVSNVTYNGVADSGNLTLPTSIVPAHSDTNIALGKTATSTPNISGQTPSMAVDGTTANGSKWSANGETNELIVDLGAPKSITRYHIIHAGGIENWGTQSLNTRDFQLQVSDNGSTWTTVDTVTGNTANETDRNVTASGRYVKLNITNPQTETTNRSARIYELQIYGSGYYKLYNRRLTGKSLFDNSGTVSYGDGTGYQYHWALENDNGFIRFRNRLTGNYMNIEANNGRIQTGPMNGWSANWMPIGSENGYFQLRSRKQALQHIHTQNDYVQSGMVGGGDWTSDQWEFVEQNNYEAEDATLSGGAVVVNDHMNYSGTGFAGGYENYGATTTFTVNAASGGSYNLDLRYANATGATKTIGLYVNGIKLRQISLPNLSNWDTWGDKVEKVNLNAGDNTIAYKYESGDSGNVSLDYITVTESNKYETENASLSGGAKVNNNQLNYSGTGFVDGYGNYGATTTFTVNNASALTCSYNLDLRYANATGGTKTISLYVNGIKLRQISLPSLANWDTWGDKVETVTLKSGSNTISYKYDDGDSGNVTLDYIILHTMHTNIGIDT
ncbi:carbohydrate-binding protein, partial [Paenibacillus sp. LMG 31458]